MKRCVVVGLSLLFIIPSFAQDEERAGFMLFGLKTRVGLNVGVNFSTASIEPEPTPAPGGTVNKSGRTDIVVAFPLEVKVANAFSVRLEPTYTQYGYTVEDKSSFFSSTKKVRRSYLEFPITGAYNFPVGDGCVQPFGFFGGVFGFRFCSEEEFFSDYTIPASERPTTQLQIAADPVDVRSSTSKFNFGVTVGGGAEYALNNAFSLMLDVRYILGLTNTYTKPANVTLPANTAEPSAKLRGFQIRVGGMYAL